MRQPRPGLGADFHRLLAAVGGSGLGDGARMTAFPLLTASLTRSTDLERANGRLFAVQNATVQFTGPPLGGFLFSVQRAVPFLLDAVSLLWAAVFLRGIRRLPRELLGDGPAILAGSALTGLPLLVLGLFPTVPVAVGVLVLTGAAEGVWQVLTASLRQAVIPDRLLGRVLGAFRLTGRGAMFLGAAGAGALAEVAGLRTPAIAAGIGVPLTTLALTGLLSTASIQRARAEGGPTSASDATARLLRAVADNDVGAVQDALADGADLERRDGDGRTPLVTATKADRVEVARVLLQAGADPDAKDDLQDSAFLYAGAEGLDEILAMTLDQGADVRSTNRFGGTALIPASEHAHVETVRTLIAAGVPLDHVNNLGWTALHEAIVLGNGDPDHVTVVRLLLDAGADATIPDRNGTLPRQLAADAGHTAIVAELDRHR